MSTQRILPTVTTYYIAHDGKAGGVCHHGVIDKGLVVATGQANLEQFTSEANYKTRLAGWLDVTTPAFVAELADEVAWAKKVAAAQAQVEP